MDGAKTVGIISKPGVPGAERIIADLFRFLGERGVAVRCDRETAAYAGRGDGLSREDVPEGCEFVVVLGGDGTLLAAARAVASRQIPIFGVNLGALGFLSAINVDELYPELERALRNEHRIGHRRMIRCEVQRGEQTISVFEALNDVVITRRATAHMIDLDVSVDRHFVCSYKADGVIVCTPTGSTAYSLSAGGPIMFPTVPAFAITPICPHMLTNRPVIVPDTVLINILCRSADDQAYLSADGWSEMPLNRGDRVLCRASENAVKLIRPPRLLYFDVLRQKLKWGER